VGDRGAGRGRASGEWQGFTSYLRRDLKKQPVRGALNQARPACVDAIVQKSPH